MASLKYKEFGGEWRWYYSFFWSEFSFRFICWWILKSGQTTQSVQLHTDTQINLKGSITTISSGLVKPLTISLSVKDVGRLGVWCLTKEPFFNLLPYVRYKGNGIVKTGMLMRFKLCLILWILIKWYWIQTWEWAMY